MLYLFVCVSVDFLLSRRWRSGCRHCARASVVSSHRMLKDCALLRRELISFEQQLLELSVAADECGLVAHVRVIIISSGTRIGIAMTLGGHDRRTGVMSGGRRNHLTRQKQQQHRHTDHSQIDEKREMKKAKSYCFSLHHHRVPLRCFSVCVLTSANNSSCCPKRCLGTGRMLTSTSFSHFGCMARSDAMHAARPNQGHSRKPNT